VTRGETSAPPVSRHSSGHGAGGLSLSTRNRKLRQRRAGLETPPPVIPPRELKWLWRGGLGLVVGALCLLGAVVTAANWHWPQPAQAHPAPRLSIIVLPFTELGDDRDAHDLANGLTEDLSTDLSLVPDFLVTSRHTAFTYGNKLVGTKQIGRELSVRYVLNGSVQRSRDRLRVNAHLIDAETDTHLWAARFDRDTADLPALQNEITNRIAVALNAAILNTEASRSTDHPDALGYTLQARAIWWKPRTRDNFTEAVGLLEHAIASIRAQSKPKLSWVMRS